MTTTFKSRWGYHPCDYAMYLQLKYLAKGYWLARRKVAAHQRWSCKLPHNRKGPEPVVPAVLRELHGHPAVVSAFAQARQPQPDQELVAPIGLKPDQIGRWFIALLALEKEEAKR